jgi:hypothetical protein
MAQVSDPTGGSAWGRNRREGSHRRWRKMSWVLVIWSALIVVWAAQGRAELVGKKRRSPRNHRSGNPGARRRLADQSNWQHSAVARRSALPRHTGPPRAASCVLPLGAQPPWRALRACGRYPIPSRPRTSSWEVDLARERWRSMRFLSPFGLIRDPPPHITSPRNLPRCSRRQQTGSARSFPGPRETSSHSAYLARQAGNRSGCEGFRSGARGRRAKRPNG